MQEAEPKGMEMVLALPAAHPTHSYSKKQKEKRESKEINYAFNAWGLGYLLLPLGCLVLPCTATAEMPTLGSSSSAWLQRCPCGHSRSPNLCYTC